MGETLGIFGGTFDPVHLGHLILARDAVEQFGLTRLIFVPATINPHKLARGGPAAPADARLAMLHAAIAGEPRFSVDDCELRRTGPSFTFDTVRELHARWPAAEWIYFIGADNVAELPAWHRIDELRALVRFAVFQRGDEAADGFLTVATRRIDISATEIRTRLTAGHPVRYLVPEAVATIISARRLYSPESGRPPAQRDTPASAAVSESGRVQTSFNPGVTPSLKKL